MFAADGSWNVVVVQKNDLPISLYHPCGALRVCEAISETGVTAPNGATYVSGAARSIVMAGSETDVLTLASIDDTMTIRSTVDPTDDYQGTPGSKLTTTRASTAAYWDNNGIIQYAATGTLRRDFDPRLASTTERCGYLIEEARTNLALRSEEFNNASWTNSNGSVSANSRTAPDGTTTADKLIEGSGAGTNGLVYQDPTLADSSTYTTSVFAEAGERGWLQLAFRDKNNATHRTWFNLSTGAKGSSSGTVSAYDMIACGSGRYRCYMTISSAAGATAARFYITTANADSAVTYTGDGASGVYIWGAQIEAGSFASSYIPTAGSTVTRAADLVTLAGTLFPLSQTEGTLYAKFMPQGVAANSINALSLNDNTTSEFHVIGRGTNRTALGSTYDGGSPQTAFASTATIADLTQGKVAAAYKLNDSAAALIGETVQTDIICTMPTTTQMVFGTFNSGTNRTINGWLFEAAYFPTRKSNADLATLAAA